MPIKTVRYNISSRHSVVSEEAARYISVATKSAYSTAEKQLKLGESGFFYTDDLSHESNRKSHAKNTRKFINGLIKVGIDPFIIGITEEQTWYDVTDIKEFEVKVEDVMSQLTEFSNGL